MEDNKEILTEEAEKAAEEATALSDEDTENTESKENTENTDNPEAEENTDETIEEIFAESDETEAQKKSKLIQRTIIISALVVAVALIGAIACRLLLSNGIVKTNIFGAKKTTCWHYTQPMTGSPDATADEAQELNYYFIFEPDGKLNIEVGSIELTSDYSIQYLTKEDVQTIENGEGKIGTPVLNISNANTLSGKYFFEVTGNAFTENKLKLTNILSDQMKLDFDDKEYTPVKIQREGEFTADEKLEGNWTFADEAGTRTYSFNSDGTYTMTDKANNAIQKTKGLYSCKDGKVSLTSNYGTDVTSTLRYEFKDDKLVIYEQFYTMYGAVEQPIEYSKEA